MRHKLLEARAELKTAAAVREQLEERLRAAERVATERASTAAATSKQVSATTAGVESTTQLQRIHRMSVGKGGTVLVLGASNLGRLSAACSVLSVAGPRAGARPHGRASTALDRLLDLRPGRDLAHIHRLKG